MRSLVCLIALTFALTPCFAHSEGSFYDAMPYFLQVTQEER